MRWLLRALAALIGVVIVGFGVVAMAARFSDGSIGPFPGGPLESGEWVRGEEPDWSFARDIPTLDFQLVTPPRSRTIWLLVHDRRLFVVSGYMNTTLGGLWKQWPLEAESDPRAVIRVDGKRYARRLERIRAPELYAPLATEIRRKYGVPATPETFERGDTWLYELLPREGGELATP